MTRKNSAITCLVSFPIWFVACSLVRLVVISQADDSCDLNLANITCTQICNGTSTCNSSCPSWDSLRECVQKCSNSRGCPGNYKCHIPGDCKQDCYNGRCECSGKKCTQKCSSSYCKNTDMDCQSTNCHQTCSGDCSMQCSKNDTGKCSQTCMGNCKDIKCGHKSCIQDTNCRGIPCTLHCSSNVNDCRQTCSSGFCKFNCNARICQTNCKSGTCKYEGAPRENAKRSCDRINLGKKECIQEGCGWPNCSLHCESTEKPGATEVCEQSCLDPISICPLSMNCAHEKDCMQNCYGKCPEVKCTSDKCSQLCSGKCAALNCNTTTTCLQLCEGTCNTIECSSPSCIQSCSSDNCAIRCNDKATDCHQTCNAKGLKKGCTMESKANSTEHQNCGKNCTLMKCGEKSSNCTQTCTQGCERMVCSSSACVQECTYGNCTLECTSSVQYCKQTCKTGNCSVICKAQKCEQECDGPGCPPRPTTIRYSPTPTSLNTTSSAIVSTYPMTPVTFNVTRPTQPSTSNATRPTQPSTSNTTRPTQPSTSNTTRPKQPSTSNATRPTQPSTYNATRHTEPGQSVSTTFPNRTTWPTKNPTATIQTEMTPTTQVTEPVGSSFGGETSAQKKIEELIQSKDEDLLLLLYIIIGLLALLVLILLMGFACVLKRIKLTSGEPGVYNISSGKLQNVYENSAL